MAKQFSFTKKERLKSKKAIHRLFTTGDTTYCRPIKCYFLPAPTLTYSQVFIVVPKRLIRKAVHRNRLKRRIREIYRQYPKSTQLPFLQLAYCYTQSEVVGYQKIEAAIHRVMEGIKATLQDG